MTLPSSTPAALRRALPAATVALLALVGCKGNSGGTQLYVFDSTANEVAVWNDVTEVYNPAKAGTTVPAPDRTISSDLFSSETLGWGALTIDSNKNVLYLVGETTGTVYAISQANTQNGSISQTNQITSFTLGLAATDRFSSGSVFGQAAVDQSNNILYVMETSVDGTGTRVWKIPNASQVAQTLGNSYTFTPATSYTTAVAQDTYGTGLAVDTRGSIYGLFGSGATIYDSLDATYSGPRLRQGPGGVFVSPGSYSTNVLIGGNTLLANPLTLGSLGYDAQNNALYVFSGPLATGATPILVFTQNQFTLNSNFNQAPARTLPDSATTLAGLRIISHPPTADWLLGATYNAPTSTGTGAGTGTGNATLLLWNGPSGGASSVQATLPNSSSGAIAIRGMAIGGNS